MSDTGPRYFSRAELRAFLEQRGIALKKRWGQNFLCDPNVLRNIVSLIDREHRQVWEIGPGLGVLTAALLERGHDVAAFEIDWGLVRALQELFAAELVQPNSADWAANSYPAATEEGPSGFPGGGSREEPGEPEERRSAARGVLRIVPGDVLGTWRALWEEVRPDAIVGNLPYRSSQAILGSLIEHGAVPSQIVATLQREVAERALAPAGNSEYSSFTVLLRTRCTVRRHFDISGECFYPRPEVASTVIELRPRHGPWRPTDLSDFSNFVQACFRARRKTLYNNLKAISGGPPEGTLDSLLQGQGIPLSARAEEVEPDTFYTLYTRFTAEC